MEMNFVELLHHVQVSCWRRHFAEPHYEMLQSERWSSEWRRKQQQSEPWLSWCKVCLRLSAFYHRLLVPYFLKCTLRGEGRKRFEFGIFGRKCELSSFVISVLSYTHIDWNKEYCWANTFIPIKSDRRFVSTLLPRTSNSQRPAAKIHEKSIWIHLLLF